MCEKERKALFDKHSEGLSIGVKNVLWMLIEGEVDCNNAYIKDNEVSLQICLSESIICSLILKKCNTLMDIDADYISFAGYTNLMRKDNGIYKLVGNAEYYEKGYSEPIILEFEDAFVDINECKIGNYISYGGIKPWDMLIYNANSILEKYSLDSTYLNDKENELIPLLAELSKLEDYYIRKVYEEYSNNVFPCLREYIVKYGYIELLKILDKLENVPMETNKYNKLSMYLKGKLNAKEYEPLWREIYNKIIESQSEYKDKMISDEEQDNIECITNIIHNCMLDNGYVGEYPCYKKKAEFTKIHLVASYDIPYFIINEKNVWHHICFCIEDSKYYDDLLLQISCGSELLKPEENEGDIYSCMFDARGKCLFSNIVISIDDFNDDGHIDEECIKEYITAVIKKTELKKLTKQERKKVKMLDSFSLITLWLMIFVVLGGLFSALFIGGMMLVTLVIDIIFSSWNEAIQAFTELPWLSFFIGTWIGYGGIMGCIYVYINKR